MDESEYKNARTKMPYLCPKHGKKTITIDTINNGGKCKQCSMEEFGREISRSTEDVIEIIESKNGNKIINPDDYVNVNTPNLRIICGSCGQEFTTSLASIMASQGHCYSCGQQYSKGEDDVESFLVQNGILFESQKGSQIVKINDLFRLISISQKTIYVSNLMDKDITSRYLDKKASKEPSNMTK